MKVEVADLRTALDLVSRAAVRSRYGLPILKHICLRGEKDGLRLSATNLDISISTTVAASEVEHKAVTVPAGLLTAYIKALMADAATLAIDDEKNAIAVDSTGEHATIKGFSAEDFPEFPEVPSNGFELSQATLSGLVPRAAIAASDNEARLVLTGILVEIRGNLVRMVATDGFRLSEATCMQDWGGLEETSVTALIPATAFNILMKVCKQNPDDAVKMALSQTRVFFTVGNTLLIADLIDGMYPEYTQIIPKGWNTRVVIADVEGFLRAAKMLKLFGVAIKMNIKDEQIELYGGSSEDEEGRAEIEAVIEGPDLEIGLSPKYLADVLGVMHKDAPVELLMSTPTTPILIQQGDSFQHVIMPMNL